MKTSHKFLVLALLTLAFSGCSSCPKKGCAVATPEPVTPPAQVVEQVAAPVVQEAAPVVKEAAPVVQEPVEEKIPAAVLK